VFYPLAIESLPHYICVLEFICITYTWKKIGAELLHLQALRRDTKEILIIIGALVSEMKHDLVKFIKFNAELLTKKVPLSVLFHAIS